MILKAASIMVGKGNREYAEAAQEALSAKSRGIGRAMSYRDFTLVQVKQRFGLLIQERPDVFATIEPRPVSTLLHDLLRRHLPRAISTGTEKGISELVIAPVLIEAVEQLPQQVSYFSGREFTVDEKEGLAGFADFLLSRSPEQYTIEAPVVVVVEAKRDEFQTGVPQCLAGMVAAQRFNQRAGKETKVVFGVVTNGLNWQFMSLSGVDVTVDLTLYYINEVERIVGILVHMLTADEPPAAGRS